MSSKPEPGNEDRHYRGEVQPINYIETVYPDALLGNVTKYICRHKRKGKKEDLLKAKWYVTRYLDYKNGNYRTYYLDDLSSSQNLSDKEYEVLIELNSLKTEDAYVRYIAYDKILILIDNLIEEYGDGDTNID